MSEAKGVLFVHDGKMNMNGLDLETDYFLRALSKASISTIFLARRHVDIPGIDSLTPAVNPAKLVAALPGHIYYGASKRFFSWWAARKLRSLDHGVAIAWARGARTLFQKAKRHQISTLLLAGNIHIHYDLPARFHAAWPAMDKSYRRAEYDLADIIATHSIYARSTYLSQGIVEEKVVALHRGYDATIFYPPSKPSEKFRVIFCGKVAERKGAHLMLEAWQKAGLHDAELWFAGNLDGEMKRNLSKYNLSNIRFLGFVKDTGVIMRQCAAIFLPSRNEGLPKALVEAAACGLAVAATPVCGFPIQEGRTGFYLTRCADNIAHRLRYFCEHQEECRRMGREAAAWVRTHFSWDKCQDDFVRIVQDLLARHSLTTQKAFEK
jgi:glycosyltransferase involved in cell wall biosynthesis